MNENELLEKIKLLEKENEQLIIELSRKIEEIEILYEENEKLKTRQTSFKTWKAGGRCE